MPSNPERPGWDKLPTVCTLVPLHNLFTLLCQLIWYQRPEKHSPLVGVTSCRQCNSLTMDYGTTRQWIPTAVGSWSHLRQSVRGPRVSTRLYVPSPMRPYYNSSGLSSVALLCCIGTNPEEQERLRILGTVEAQNIRVGLTLLIMFM